MNLSKIRRISSTAPFLSGVLAIVLAAAIVASPEAAFQASLQGLKLWWTLVFPALLPFLMLSEMLTASGTVHGIGALLEPVMRRLFRLPGTGGWLLTLGLTAGFPAGADGGIQLYKQGSLTGKDVQRLAAVSHFANPVTLLIVIGVGLLRSPEAGYALLAVHWLSGLLAGCTYSRLTAGKQAVDPPSRKHAAPLGIKGAIQAAGQARAADGRGFGKLLGDSVASSVQKLMVVGGYMIIFSVIIHIVNTALPWLPPPWSAALLELHLGAGGIAANMLGSPHRLLPPALLSAALGWSGICALLQTHAVLKPAGTRFLQLASVRLLHALYAFGLTLLLWKPLMSLQSHALPAAALPAAPAPSGLIPTIAVLSTVPRLIGLQCIFLLLLLTLSAVIYVLPRLRHRKR